MSATNGSLLRLVPVQMNSAGLLSSALNGADKGTLLFLQHSPVKAFWERGHLAGIMSKASDGPFKHSESPEIRETDYVANSMQTPPQKTIGKLPDPTLEPKPTQLNGGNYLRWRWRSRRWLMNCMSTRGSRCC